MTCVAARAAHVSRCWPEGTGCTPGVIDDLSVSLMRFFSKCLNEASAVVTVSFITDILPASCQRSSTRSTALLNRVQQGMLDHFWPSANFNLGCKPQLFPQIEQRWLLSTWLETRQAQGFQLLYRFWHPQSRKWVESCSPQWCIFFEGLSELVKAQMTTTDLLEGDKRLFKQDQDWGRLQIPVPPPSKRRSSADLPNHC